MKDPVDFRVLAGQDQDRLVNYILACLASERGERSVAADLHSSNTKRRSSSGILKGCCCSCIQQSVWPSTCCSVGWFVGFRVSCALCTRMSCKLRRALPLFQIERPQPSPTNCHLNSLLYLQATVGVAAHLVLFSFNNPSLFTFFYVMVRVRRQQFPVSTGEMRIFSSCVSWAAFVQLMLRLASHGPVGRGPRPHN